PRHGDRPAQRGRGGRGVRRPPPRAAGAAGRDRGRRRLMNGRHRFLRLLAIVLLALLAAPRGAGAQEVPEPPITVSFQDADIRDVLATFAEFTGRSIVPGAGVSG